MDIFDVRTKVALISDAVFLESALPDASFTPVRAA